MVLVFCIYCWWVFDVGWWWVCLVFGGWVLCLLFGLLVFYLILLFFNLLQVVSGFCYWLVLLCLF